MWTVLDNGNSPGRRIGYHVRQGIGTEHRRMAAAMTMAHESLARLGKLNALTGGPRWTVRPIPRRRMTDTATVRIVAQHLLWMMPLSMTDRELDATVANLLAAYAPKPRRACKKRRTTHS